MKKPTEIKIVPVILVMLLAVSAFAAVIYYSNHKDRLNSIWVQHTHEVLYKSEKVLSVLKDVETGTRGFVITGDTAFLQPYYYSKDSIQSGIEILKNLTADNPVQQARIDSLALLASRRIAMCSTVLKIRQSKNYNAEAIIPLLKAGKAIMDKIRTVISSIQLEENRLLTVREAANESGAKKSKQTFFIFLGSILLMMIAGVVAISYFDRFNKTAAAASSQLNVKFPLFAQRMNDVIKGISDPFFSLDENYVFIYHNDVVQNTIGIGKGSLVGKNIFEAFPQYNKNIVGEKIKEAMILKTTFSFEVHDDFLAQWQEISIYPTTEGIAVYIRDAGKRKAYEKELHAMQQLLDETNEVAMLGGWEVDMLTGIVTWTSVTGLIHETAPDYKPDLKTGFAFYKEGKDRDTIIQLVEEAVEEGREWDATLRIFTARGNEKWVRTKGRPVFEGDTCVRMFGTLQDVDEQKKNADMLKRQEKKIKEEKKMLKDIIDSLPLNLYVKDTDLRKTLVNKSEVKYMGAENEEAILGKTDFELYPAATAAISAAEDKEVIITKKAILDRETKSIKNDGTETLFLTSKIPFINEEGEVTGLLGISYETALIKRESSGIMGNK
jgi:CHASE3 domain sensor protein